MQVWTNRDRHGEVNSYDYDISVSEDNTVELYYSDTTDWAEPGQRLATLSDDGNGIKILLGSKKIKLDYHEVVELLALLLFHHQDKIELRETQIIKSI